MKKLLTKVGVGVAAMTGSAAVLAAEASQGASAISGLSSQVSELITAAWPVAIAVSGGMIGIKLFKKFANRAS